MIREIEAEIRERSQLAEKLQAGAKQAERLFEINGEEPVCATDRNEAVTGTPASA